MTGIAIAHARKTAVSSIVTSGLLLTDDHRLLGSFSGVVHHHARSRGATIPIVETVGMITIHG